jgi:hypothetical protein
VSLVNFETGELIEVMDADAARRLTERIRIAATNYTEAKAKVLRLVDEAKAGQAHVALGYTSWPAYLSDVLSDEPLRLASDDRRVLHARLSGEGMSTRDIAPITGVSHETVAQDLKASPVRNLTPAPITGHDGKTYTRPTTPRTPPRRALTDAARDAGQELRKATERLERLGADDRFTANKNEVAAHLRHHLDRAIEVCQDLNNRINN